jgi:hypothetical protein
MTGARLALELEGWLELKLPERVLERVQPLLDDPQTRAVGLRLRIEALAELGRHAEALAISRRPPSSSTMRTGSTCARVGAASAPAT